MHTHIVHMAIADEEFSSFSVPLLKCNSIAIWPKTMIFFLRRRKKLQNKKKIEFQQSNDERMIRW